MKLLLWIIGCIVCLILLIYFIGLLLPKERIVMRQSVFNVSPEILYSIVIDNEDWTYRSELNDLTIIEKKGDWEIWEETTRDGAVIRFTTKEKNPFSFYSFNMESNMFSGYWTATFQFVEGDKTLFTATEYISIKNPFIKTLSYLFFDIGKLMDNYQRDLRVKVEKG